MSCCGSLFVNLGGGGGGTIATGVLQIAGGVALDSTLRFVEDQNGTDSKLKLNTSEISFDFNVPLNWRSYYVGSFSALYAGSNDLTSFSLLINTSSTYIGGSSDINFWVNGSERGYLNNNGLALGTGTKTQNGVLTVKGAGANIASFRDSSNVEQGNISDSGKLTIKEVEVETGFTAKYNSTKIIEAVQVSGSTGLGFFAAPAIVQPTTSIANATYANVSGTEIKENDTFDGYTVGQVVQALRNLGLLA